MPVHQRIASLVGPFIRSQLRGAARYTYSTLRIQDKIIDKTYRKAGLYNRGLVKGIQHGLISGQIIGGTLNLGLDKSNGNNGVPSQDKRTKPTSNKPYKTRRRFPIRDRSCDRRGYQSRTRY